MGPAGAEGASAAVRSIAAMSVGPQLCCHPTVERPLMSESADGSIGTGDAPSATPRAQSSRSRLAGKTHRHLLRARERVRTARDVGIPAADGRRHDSHGRFLRPEQRRVVAGDGRRDVARDGETVDAADGRADADHARRVGDDGQDRRVRIRADRDLPHGPDALGERQAGRGEADDAQATMVTAFAFMPRVIEALVVAVQGCCSTRAPSPDAGRSRSASAGSSIRTRRRPHCSRSSVAWTCSRSG